METQAQEGLEAPRIRVGLLTASPMGAEALAVALGEQTDIDIVVATTDKSEFHSWLGSDAVDVVLVGLRREADDVFEILSHPAVKSGRARAVVIASSAKRDQHADVRAAGAAGFLPVSAHVSEAIEAIREVARGRTFFRTCDLIREVQPTPPSRREFELLRALRTGSSNAEIAHVLGISTRTVESHLRRLFARYGTASRAELLMLALRNGWVQLDGPIAESDTPPPVDGEPDWNGDLR